MNTLGNTIITIYGTNAFKRFLLPAINDADYSIHLSRDLFGLADNIELKLEISDHYWYFAESDDYEIKYIKDEELNCTRKSLQSFYNDSQSEFRIMVDGQYVLSIIISVTDRFFSQYTLYDISYLSQPITIGRKEENVISYNYSEIKLVSGEHAVVFKDGDRCIFQDLNSSNGSFVNNRRITGSVVLNYGDSIDIYGLRLVYLGDRLAVNIAESGATVKENALEEVNSKPRPINSAKKHAIKTIFHRSPRRIAKLEDDEVKIDDPPAPKEEIKQRGILSAIGGALSMALPMLLGCAFMIYASQVSGFSRGLFMYIGVVTAVTSAIIGTIRSVVGMRRAVKEYKEYENLRSERYGKYLRDQEQIIKTKYEKNTKALLDRYVSAEECSRFDSGNIRLWSRNINQDDFLVTRLGIGDIPFQVDIKIPDKKFSMTDNNLLDITTNIQNTYKTLHDVPVCIDLMKERLVGVIEGKNCVRDIVIQLAANNSYTDVKMAFVYDEKRGDLEKNWEFVKWLPHVWNEPKTFRFVASNKEEASDVFYELNKVIQQRIEEKQKNTVIKPHYVIFIAAPEYLEDEMVAKYLTEPDEKYGITTIYIADQYEQLANQCEVIIEESTGFCGLYNISDDEEEKRKLRFDEVSIKKAEDFAYRIANIEINEIETGGDIPTAITFLEMYGVSKPEELDAITRWKKNRTYESMRALVGQKAGGAPCYLDIHEKYHGPHGLVAGTTGSGKSETLQTYILSLAINFSPDDVGFFIIDYKGGGMANLFTRLPHMIGQISNLSGNQVNRALVSIQSEKDRREKLFSDYGVKDIRDYTKLYKNGDTMTPLPHLIIVIDEFAEMKNEEPEFIQEIVSVSRVGRSLGIHLIMATQKPAGSVSEDIWSNSRFKLCLRVQSRQDSMDMLHKADAAYLTQSGRCYLQVGNDELYEQFQSGYSGALYYEDDDMGLDIAKMLGTTGVPSLEGNHMCASRQLKRKENNVKDVSQLEAIVEYIKDTAKKNNYNRDYSLFLPLLPEKLYMSDLPKIKKAKTGIAVGIGMYDDPEKQKQDTFVIDFEKAGNLLIIGAPTTGKTTFIQSLMYSLVSGYTPAQANIYAMEFSARKLSVFEDYPHVGGIIRDNDDVDKLDKFFTLIEGVLNDRKELLGDISFEHYVSAGEGELPAIFVVIDNFANLLAKVSDKYNQIITKLIKEGIGCGIYMIVTAIGTGSGDIPNSMAQNFRTVICLELNNAYDYANYMRVSRLKTRPESGVKGRGIAFVGDRILEFQTALPVKAESEIEVGRFIRQSGEKAAEGWTGIKARRIPEIPQEPEWNTYSGDDDVKLMLRKGRLLPVGYDAKLANIYGIDLSNIYSYIISGGKKKGKTNTLKLIMGMAKAAGGRVILVDFEKKLHSFATALGIIYVENEKDWAQILSKMLKEDILERNRYKGELIDAGMDDLGIFDKMQRYEKIFVFIENLPLFIEHVQKPSSDTPGNITANMETIMDAGFQHNLYWFSTVNKDDTGNVMAANLYKLFIQDKKGIHLGGMVHQTALSVMNFDNQDRRTMDNVKTPGRGMLPVDNEESVKEIIVPIVKGNIDDISDTL